MASKYVLLTDNNNATLLVECEDDEAAERVAGAGVFSDGGVSAWLVPTHSVQDTKGIRNALREGYNLNYLHDVLQRTTRQRVQVNDPLPDEARVLLDALEYLNAAISAGEATPWSYLPDGESLRDRIVYRQQLAVLRNALREHALPLRDGTHGERS